MNEIIHTKKSKIKQRTFYMYTKHSGRLNNIKKKMWMEQNKTQCIINRRKERVPSI